MENTVQCPECNSENLDSSIYCCQCGRPLRKGIPDRKNKKPWGLILILTLILSSIMTAGLYYMLPSKPTGSSLTGKQSPATPNKDSVRTDTKTPEQPSGKTQQTVEPEISGDLLKEEQVAKEIEPLILGTVSIISPEGFTVNEFPAVVVNGSWLALPTRACFGGNKWFFKVGNEQAIPIEGGLWGRGDAVGLWKLGSGKTYPGPSFSTWDQGEDVRFLSIKTGLLYEPTVLNPTGMQGVFIYSSQDSPQDPGVFVQNGKVVGWSFGELLAGSYMWVLGSGTNLLYENFVDDFYNETFAGGREEYFSTILASSQSLSPQRQLQMYAEAFRLPAKLPPEDTPRYLTPDTVYPVVSKLISQVLQLGGYDYVAILVEEPLLWELADPSVIKDVASATQKVYGSDAALNFLESDGEEILKALEGDIYLPLAFHLELYLSLIKSSIDNREIGKGWQYFNRAQARFKNSAPLHLLGVELALSEGDWETAENLLYQRDYPPESSDRVSLLAAMISDLKGYENKIVIRFQPGSGEIPVTTTINEAIGQDFLIDTGATYVTIPYSTVEALGLESKVSQHQHEVQTAGGPVLANAVMLSSIELHGWIVSDVNALIIDLPNRPGLGLLGLDFLNRFNLNMEADRGILTLEPK